MEATLSINNNESFIIIPLLPVDLIIPIPINSTEQFESVQGTLNLIGNPQLREISWDSFLPIGKQKFTANGYNTDNPQFIVDWIQKANNRRIPIRLIITHNEKTLLNMPCVVTSFGYSYDSLNWINYSIALQEYRFVSSKKV